MQSYFHHQSACFPLLCPEESRDPSHILQVTGHNRGVGPRGHCPSRMCPAPGTEKSPQEAREAEDMAQRGEAPKLGQGRRRVRGQW